MVAAAMVLALAGPVALVHHPVSTTVAAAQERFDEGLTLIYSFNRREARKRFEDAARLDPGLAMAWWGVALAVGPNINESMKPEDVSAALGALAKAKARENTALPEERSYIDALAVRYPADPKGDTDATYLAYRDAMKALSSANPDDLDAATLYAESMMDTSDWGFHDGVATADQKAIVAVLDTVIARDPHHVGANHYLIHAWDAAGVAEHALPNARYLSDLAYEPADSHLQHMPGHTYLDVGDFEAMIRVARLSTLDDDAYAESIDVPPFHLRYYGHDLDFWAGSALLAGARDDIDRATAEYVRGNDVGAMLIYAIDGRYAEAEAWPKPAAKSYALVEWTYARVLCALGRKDTAAAARFVSALDAALKAQSEPKPTETVPGAVAHARLAHALGDDDAAIALLRHGLTLDANAPPEASRPWFFPAGRWLGDVLFERGDLQGAEAAYRADLLRVPNDPRVLDELTRVLAREGRPGDARALAPQIAAHWLGDSTELHEPDI